MISVKGGGGGGGPRCAVLGLKHIQVLFREADLSIAVSENDSCSDGTCFRMIRRACDLNPTHLSLLKVKALLFSCYRLHSDIHMPINTRRCKLLTM